jgi:radical SAM superfamily enzyme YgiQ (UPF0313 family)
VKDVLFILPTLSLFDGRSYRPRGYPVETLNHASYLVESGYHVEIFDLYVQDISKDQLLKKLQEKSNRIVAIPTSEYLRETLATTPFELAQTIQELVPNIPIILFGRKRPQVLGHQHLAKDMSWEYILNGDTERTMVQLLEHLERGTPRLEDIPGLCYRKNDIEFGLESCHVEKNLDHVPPIDMDMLDPKLYDIAPHRQKNLAVHYIDPARGCMSGRCEFCKENIDVAKVNGTFFRSKSPKKIVDEIEYLILNKGVKEIKFDNAQFPIVLSWIKEFRDELDKRNLKIPWSCLSKVDLVDREKLSIMKEAGCRCILFGIETFDKKLLKAVRKEKDNQNIEEVLKICREYQIEVIGSFIMAIPGETPRDVIKSAFKAASIGIDYYQIFLVKWWDKLPHSMEPGDRYVKEWNLKLGDFHGSYIVPKAYRGQKHLYLTKTLAYLCFYFHPKTIFRMISRIRNFNEVKRLATGFLMLLKVTTSSLKKNDLEKGIIRPSNRDSE